MVTASAHEGLFRRDQWMLLGALTVGPAMGGM